MGKGQNKQPTTIRLHSNCLTSKWGFHDGELLNEYVDVDCDHHKVLKYLVKTHLIPKIRENHDIEYFEINTSHNPIRLKMLDGVEIDTAAEYNQYGIKPEFVEISLEDVREASQLFIPIVGKRF